MSPEGTAEIPPERLGLFRPSGTGRRCSPATIFTLSLRDEDIAFPEGIAANQNVSQPESPSFIPLPILWTAGRGHADGSLPRREGFASEFHGRTPMPGRASLQNPITKVIIWAEQERLGS